MIAKPAPKAGVLRSKAQEIAAIEDMIAGAAHDEAHDEDKSWPSFFKSGGVSYAGAPVGAQTYAANTLVR